MSAPLRALGLAHAELGTDPTSLADAVTEAARGLQYGSIEVIVHEGRIVQIVRTDKRRLLK